MDHVQCGVGNLFGDGKAKMFSVGYPKNKSKHSHSNNKCQCSGVVRLCLVALSSASILVAALGIQANEATQNESKNKGFIVSNWVVASSAGPQDCPNGLTLDAVPAYLETLSNEERDRLTKPKNATELVYAASGDKTRDTCNYPSQFSRPATKLVEGNTAPGMNLDGKISAEDFTSPSGESGIDNQFYRVTGCTKRYRRGASLDASDAIMAQGDETIITALREGEMTILIDINGLDDIDNDDNIVVGFYSGVDRAILDAQGRVMANSTQRITDNKKWHNQAPGKIVDGVITSEPIDLHLKYQASVGYGDIFLRQARVNFSIDADGQLNGMLAGYYDIESYWGYFPRSYGRSLVIGGGFECSAYYKSLNEQADGPLDGNGKRNGISVAFNIEATPAFVLQPPTVGSP